MNPIKVFNPEHDMALSNGDKHFIAPKNIREMASDLAPLLDVMNSEQFIVWGWDHAIKTQLQRMGVAADMLPTDTALTALRACSERKSAHYLLRAFHADHPDGPYIGESILAYSIGDVAAYAVQHGHIILKDPLSSSGKGLRHVNEGEISLSSLKKVENWVNALIRRHGYLTAEPYYDKVQDFAMEFCVRKEQCHFIGYSLFNTNHHGRYESNLLMADEKIEALLSQYIPQSALHEVQEWVMSNSLRIIPSEWDTTQHPLYFGIDMMIVKTTDNVHASEHDASLPTNRSASAAELNTKFNSQLSTPNFQFKLHPCVEINLRLNMGIIAHEVHQHLLTPDTEGSFHVTSFPNGEAAQLFYKEHTEQYPSIYQEEKITSGYLPLTPIYPHTRHHAYIIVTRPVSPKDSFR